MLIKEFLDEDTINYKKCSMFIGFPNCSFKCDKEADVQICQNYYLLKTKTIEISVEDLVKRYLTNIFSEAIVYGGLEPFDSFDDLLKLTAEFRKQTKDDIVIYTGYTEEEISKQIKQLKQFSDIIIKFGRFKYDEEKHFDELLGVELASSNQYAEKIS